MIKLDTNEGGCHDPCEEGFQPRDDHVKSGPWRTLVRDNGRVYELFYLENPSVSEGGIPWPTRKDVVIIGPDGTILHEQGDTFDLIVFAVLEREGLLPV